jgi:hypothetical protein
LALGLLVMTLPAAGCSLFSAAGKFLADEFYVIDAPPPDQPFREGDPASRQPRPVGSDRPVHAQAQDLLR